MVSRGAQRLEEFDVLLVVGMDLLRQYVYHEPSRAIPESIRLVHIDEDPWQLGKNYPVEVGVTGHTKVTLGELGRRNLPIPSAMNSRLRLARERPGMLRPMKRRGTLCEVRSRAATSAPINAIRADGCSVSHPSR